MIAIEVFMGGGRRPKPFGIGGRGGGVRVRAVRGPRGDGRYYWRAETYEQGKSHNVWAGWATEDEATRQVASIVASGELDRPPSPEASTEVVTVADLMECWVGEQVTPRVEDGRLKPKSGQLYRQSAKRIKRELGGVVIMRLGRRELDAWASVALRGRAPKTVLYDQRMLVSAWKWGVAIGACPRRDLPMRFVPDKAVRPKQTPSPADIAAVLGELTGWRRNALVLLWHTGARLGEVSTLTWDRVLEDALILEGKTGRREVPVSPELLDQVQRWRRGDNVPRGGDFVLGVLPVTTMGLSTRWLKPACKRLKVTPFTAHGVRRAVVDRLVVSGVDVGTAAELLGHSIEMMLKQYRQVSGVDRRAAVRRAQLGLLPRGKVIQMGREER